jgi:hypothetical protein
MGTSEVSFLPMACSTKEVLDDRSSSTQGSQPSRPVPPMDQEDETINHLLISSVFTQQFWFSFLQQVKLEALSSQPQDASFQVRWKGANECVGGSSKERPQFAYYVGRLDSLEASE